MRGKDPSGDELPRAGDAQWTLPDDGGLSTGPRTANGLERSRKARYVHGRYSAERRAEQREARRQWRALRALLESF